MSFINPFKSPLKKSQSVVEFLVIATAIIAAMALGGPAMLNAIGGSGQNLLNKSAGKMGIILRGNATVFVNQ